MKSQKSQFTAGCLLVAVCAFLSSAWAVPRCELNGKSVSPYNGSTTDGLTGVMRCKEESTGLPTSEQELRGGVFMGLSRFYDSNCNIQRERLINERGNTDGFRESSGPMANCAANRIKTTAAREARRAGFSRVAKLNAPASR